MQKDGRRTGVEGQAEGGKPKAPGAQGAAEKKPREKKPAKAPEAAAQPAPEAPKAEKPAAEAQPKKPEGEKQAKEQPKKPAPKAPEGPVFQLPANYVPRLKERYQKEIIPQLMRDFSIKNVMEVPSVRKVIINIGMGEALENAKALENAVRDVAAIAGQQPVVTRAKKSIANFKIRRGQGIGVMVTLRGARMYEFLDRLINITIPRIRDFRGLPNRGFDGRGNYTIGLREQSVFPEIDFNSIDKIRGMQITIVTSAKNDQVARRLLVLMGWAFAKEGRPKDAAA
jgi:large subunit ribosomal protein L5